MNKNLGMSAPWYRYVRELDALFGKDPEITIEFEEDTNTVKLLVENPFKADALTKLLPVEKCYSNVTLKIKVIPANLKDSKISLFTAAFDGNPAFSYAKTIEGVFTNPLSYLVFKKEVVQFWMDNLGDVNGLESTLYQDIAEDIFEDHDGICFCTDDQDRKIG